MKHQLLIVDGYNMIGAWPELKVLKKQNKLEEARDTLLAELSEYAIYNALEIVVVFDAQFVSGIAQSYKKYSLQVVFTASDQTADDYIEGYAYDRLNPLTRVTVATSDLAEQWQIFSAGALRKPARELYKDVHKNKKNIRTVTSEYHQNTKRMTWNDQQLSQLDKFLKELQTRDE